jgi:hypothetical protein
MSFFKKLFGSSAAPAQATISREANEKRIRENTDQLWKFIEELLVDFNNQSCQCAFPRFRQIVGIDCVDHQCPQLFYDHKNRNG